MVTRTWSSALWSLGGKHYQEALLPALAQRFAKCHHSLAEWPEPSDSREGRTVSYLHTMESCLQEALAELGSIDAFAYFDSGYIGPDAGSHPDPVQVHHRLTHEIKRGLAFARLAAKYLVSSGRKGAITWVVDSAGMAGRFTALDASLYASATAGMAKSLAKELGRYGVRVNVLGYGFIQGFPAKDVRPEENALLKLSGLGGEMPASSFLATLAHLHDEDCLINGQWVLADGGLLI